MDVVLNQFPKPLKQSPALEDINDSTAGDSKLIRILSPNTYLAEILRDALGKQFPIFSQHIQNNDLGLALLSIMFEPSIQEHLDLISAPLVQHIDASLNSITPQIKPKTDMIADQIKEIQSYYDYLTVNNYLNSSFSGSSLKESSERSIISINKDLARLEYAKALRYIRSMPQPYMEKNILYEYNQTRDKNDFDIIIRPIPIDSVYGVIHVDDPTKPTDSFEIKTSLEKVKSDRETISGLLGLSIHHISAMSILACEIDRLLNP